MRRAVPASRLIVDANESWNESQLREFMPALIDFRVELIEQPLPAEADDALARWEHPIPLCADESCRTRADLDRLHEKYEVIHIKLDKAGGLTEAFALAAEAKRRGFRIMVGGASGPSRSANWLCMPTMKAGAMPSEVDSMHPVIRPRPRCLAAVARASASVRPPALSSLMLMNR